MALNKENRYDWEDVYTQAVALREQQPWNILPGEIVFKINSPYLNQPGYCLFTGSSGEVFSMIIYLGEAGYQNLLEQHAAGIGNFPQYINFLNFFNQHAVQVEFVNPDELEKTDKAKHKVFKIPMSGQFRGIKVRHFRPGLLSSELHDRYLPFVADCLEQANAVTELALNDDSIEEQYAFDRVMLVRTGKETKEDVTWKTTREEASGRQPRDLNLLPPSENKLKGVAAMLAGLPMRDKPMIYHIQYTAHHINNKREPPYYPLICSFLEKGTGFAYPPQITHRAKISGLFPNFFAKQLKELGYYPSSIIGTSAFCCQLLEPYCEALGIELQFDVSDPNVLEFSEGLWNSGR